MVNDPRTRTAIGPVVSGRATPGVRTGTVGDTSDDRQPRGRNEVNCGADALERTTRGVDSCVAAVLRTISRQTGTGVPGLRLSDSGAAAAGLLPDLHELQPAGIEVD
jgi:hypothetical protein